MSIKFNDQLLFYGLGVIQPATPSEVIEFLRLIYPDITQWPDEEMLNQIFLEWLRLHYVIILGAVVDQIKFESNFSVFLVDA